MAIRIKIGDIFEVKMDEGSKKFFQYVANDITMLNSSVIKVFKNIYRNDDALDLEEVVKDEVDFYAHVFLRNGLKQGYWNKVGHIEEVGKIEVLFRNTDDYGKEVKVSENWYVWKINEPFIKVGKLEGKNKIAEIGVVKNAGDIVCRMRTGKYDFVYPQY
jgi:hypothetical protein